MNFYPMHIGDYMAHTAHLEPMEDLAYRRMIDLYYLRESALPVDPAEVAKLIRLRGEVESVKSVLAEFFKLTDEGWVSQRCEYEISEAQSKRSKAAASAALRWESERNATAMRTHTEGNAPNPNPITTPSKTLKPSSDYSGEFIEAWDAYPSRPGASKKDSFKAWSARVKEGIDPGLILDGVRRYAAYCKATSKEPQYVKQPTTFFGPGEHYLADWTPSAPRASPRQSIHEQRAETIAILTGQKNVHDERERDITGTATRIA